MLICFWKTKCLQENFKKKLWLTHLSTLSKNKTYFHELKIFIFVVCTSALCEWKMVSTLGETCKIWKQESFCNMLLICTQKNEQVKLTLTNMWKSLSYTCKRFFRQLFMQFKYYYLYNHLIIIQLRWLQIII